MKALKTIGIILGAIVLVLVVIGLIAPKSISTEKSIVINAPSEAVFPYLQYFESQKAWSPWNERDPDMKSEIIGEDGTVGALNKWESATEGNGEQEITELISNERVATVLRFDGMGTAEAYLNAADTEEGTLVTWGFYSKTPFPWNVMNVFMGMQGMLEKDYEKGLNNLKTLVETQAAMKKMYRGYEVQVVDAPAKYFIALRETIPFDKISEGYQKNLGKIFGAVQNAGIEMAGMPCGLFYVWDEANQQTEMAYAIPVATQATVKGYETIEIPAGKLLMIDYYGPYEGTAEAHFAMDEYIKEHGIDAGVPVWEEYVTDPGQEPDTAKWLTKVCYPIKNN